MPWTRKRTRELSIVAVLSFAVIIAIVLVRRQPPAQISCHPAHDAGLNPFYTLVSLTFKELQPAGNVFSGPVIITVKQGQASKQAEDAAQEFRKTVLRFEHFKGSEFEIVGNTDGAIDFASVPLSDTLVGKGTFWWKGVSQTYRGPFYYPFDRYVLSVNPFLVKSDGPKYFTDPVDSLDVDFGGLSFVPQIKSLRAQSRNDDFYEITLQRPALLRVIAGFVAVLLLFWLAYLIWFAKAEENVGQVVTLFIGVFSIRSSLLSGAPVFPGLIDYCTLAVYLSAVLIVLVKWKFPDQNTKECPFCKSFIPLTASVCPQCTLTVGVQA